MIGHFWHICCLLRHVIKIKIEGRIEEWGRRGRRRKQLMDVVKETRGYCEFKDEFFGELAFEGVVDQL